MLIRKLQKIANGPVDHNKAQLHLWSLRGVYRLVVSSWAAVVAAELREILA